MLLLQAQPSDSTVQTIKAVSDAVGVNGVWDSFIIPIAILLFFSLVKYVTGKVMQKNIWFDFASETAIDILTVFVSFIIGRFFMTTTSQDVLITSAGKIFIVVVIAIFLSLIRVWVNEFMKKSEPEIWKAGGLLALEYVLSVLCIVMIFKF